MNLDDFADLLVKIGARHGSRDRGHLETAHDAIASLVDGMHCSKTDDAAEPQHMPPGGQEEDPRMGPIGMEVGKIGARHSHVDLGRIKKVHDLLCELGAKCPGRE